MIVTPIPERMAAVQSPCTLNGNAARIIGWRNDFATVVDLQSGLAVDFAWSTVTRVLCNNDGRFQS